MYWLIMNEWLEHCFLIVYDGDSWIRLIVYYNIIWAKVWMANRLGKYKHLILIRNHWSLSLLGMCFSLCTMESNNQIQESKCTKAAQIIQEDQIIEIINCTTKSKKYVFNYLSCFCTFILLDLIIWYNWNHQLYKYKVKEILKPMYIKWSQDKNHVRKMINEQSKEPTYLNSTTKQVKRISIWFEPNSTCFILFL
jgi:hypothetical protein